MLEISADSRKFGIGIVKTKQVKSWKKVMVICSCGFATITTKKKCKEMGQESDNDGSFCKQNMKNMAGCAKLVGKGSL